MHKVGFVGWRGMVGSVLMDRMKTENDFAHIESYFFSTSQVGQDGPDVGQGTAPLGDATDIDQLRAMNIIITCQGGDYTNDVHPKLRESGWEGYWIDAASSLRMNDSSLLVLDPVNREVIDQGLDSGIKDLIGSNCTVSPMLIGLKGLFATGEVEWVSSMTYQAASGGGARHMIELIEQMERIGLATKAMRDDPVAGILEIDRQVKQTALASDFPAQRFETALAASAIPWIDRAVDDGQTREEWKGMVETNKILGGNSNIPVDGTCVRIGSMRAHAQGHTIKLKSDIPIEDIEKMISEAHEWVDFVPNEKEATLQKLTPAAVSGELNVAVGRVRKMKMGPTFLNAYTIGDQLLWGAAEPLRRAMLIVIGEL